jgi:hypothetical protein
MPSYTSFPMQRLGRVIATLAVEARMIESHAQKLTRAASGLDQEQQRQILQLAEEETMRAETPRQQICLLQDHLVQDGPQVG